MDHSERKKNYFGFDKAERAILICTDVASRGLDFKGVEWIVQYDPSSNIKEYVNRVGRTARIAHAGKALIMLMPHEMGYLKFLGEHKCKNLTEIKRFEIIRKFQHAMKEFKPKSAVKFF
jgi:ATP-dependent RNA helicase DDX31/DBP7